MLSGFLQADLLAGKYAMWTPVDEIHSLAIAYLYTEASLPPLSPRRAVTVQIS